MVSTPDEEQHGKTCTSCKMWSMKSREYAEGDKRYVYRMWLVC